MYARAYTPAHVHRHLFTHRETIMATHTREIKITTCKHCHRKMFWLHEGSSWTMYEDSRATKRHFCDKDPMHGGEKPAKVPTAPITPDPVLMKKMLRIEN